MTNVGVNEGPELAPVIERFVLYAERSITLGPHCRAHEGDVGVRSVVQRMDERKGSRPGSSQLALAKHARCRNVFAPSISLAIYSEVRDVWTESLTRHDDIGIGVQHAFPAQMPPLPLASAAAAYRPKDVFVARRNRLSIAPGAYGALTLLYESELWLAPGRYTFASVRMDERAKLLGEYGTVEVEISGRLWTDREARIGPRDEDGPAEHFTIAVAGDDTAPANWEGAGDRATGRGGELIGSHAPVVEIAAEARIHALLAAPHGTVSLGDRAMITGAVAGFDIVAGDGVHAEFQCGFPAASAGGHGSQQLSGYFGVPAPSVAPLVGPVPGSTQVHLAVGLPVRDAAGLESFIAQVSDPKHANFRKFLTQAEFNATYAATDSDYASLEDWATNSNAFTITATYPNNLLLSVSATAAEIERALYVNLVYRRRNDGSDFVTVDRDPSLDLAVPILEISGLNDYITPHRLVTLNGTGTGQNYRAADIRNAYLGVGSSCQTLDGTGQVAGIVDFDVFAAADIAGYDGLQLPVAGQSPLPATNVTVVATEGGNPATNSALEATLDVEMVHAMAPNAQILFFQGSTGITDHLDDILHAMATSATPLTVASCSLGFGYTDNSNQALGQMAANGVSFFTASGDGGDIGTNDPGNLKLANQTLVGGTFLSTNPLISPLPAPVYPSPYYAGENTWAGGSGATTGGGILNDADIPDYQLGVSMASNGGSTKFRNYPDVAMLASNVEVFFGGSTQVVGGTSAAAPLWAGYTALVNQLGQQNGGTGRSGFLNPTIYDLGLTSGSANDLYKVCFNDIQDGVSNGGGGGGGGGGGFSSVAGYDLCTGWGTPTCALINQLSSLTPLKPNQPLSLIRFVVTTGNDDAGGGKNGSTQTADVLLPGGGSFTLTLRNSSDANWDNGSTHQIDLPIPNTVIPPLTETKGIAGVRINLVQSNPDWSADNWDIANLAVSLFNPGSPHVCQLNLIGTSVLQDGSTGLVRLSKSAGDSGVGASSPVFATGLNSGC
jgi:Pro-kumamolisin, activation domain